MTMKSEHLATKTEAQAHAKWLERAETEDERTDMERKVSEYEQKRRPIHMGDLQKG